MRKSPPHLGVGRVIPLYFHTPVNEPSEQPKECEDTKIPVKKRGTFERKTQQCFGTAQRLWVFDSSRYLEGEKRRDKKSWAQHKKIP